MTGERRPHAGIDPDEEHADIGADAIAQQGKYGHLQRSLYNPDT